MNTNQITTFTFPETMWSGSTHFHDIRVVTIDGQPWFVAADVCRVLGSYLRMKNGRQEVNAAMATRHLNDDEVRSVTPNRIEGLHPQTLIISESGLYKLVMRSDKPEARRFQDWVTRIVLPAIRKDGAYVMGEEKVATGQMTEDELILRAMTALQNKVTRLTEENTRKSALIDAKITRIDVQTYQGLRGEYLSHGDKVRLAHKARTLSRAAGLEVTKIEKKVGDEIDSRGRQVYTQVNTYPFAILHEAAEELDIFEAAMSPAIINGLA